MIRDARKRREIFENLQKHLDKIREAVRRLDTRAELYLFGSVPENRHVYSSDIDVLVVTDLDPGIVRLHLWEAGIREPFQVHVQHRERIGSYRTKLVRIE